MSKQYKYQQQDSSQTLQEGLEEYYASIPGVMIPDDTEEETAKMLTSHDVTHVIFGCSTSLEDEFLCDSWTLMGSNLSLYKYLEYMKYPVTQQIFKEAGYLKVIVIGIKTLPKMIKIYLRTRKMTKKWSWSGYKQYLNRQLREIRDEFNIVTS